MTHSLWFESEIIAFLVFVMRWGTAGYKTFASDLIPSRVEGAAGTAGGPALMTDRTS